MWNCLFILLISLWSETKKTVRQTSFETKDDHRKCVKMRHAKSRPTSFQQVTSWHEYCSRHSQSSRAARIGMGNCTYRLSTTTGAARKTRPSIRWSSATTRPWCRYVSSRGDPCLTSSCKSSRSFCDAVSWPMDSPESAAAIAATTAWSHFHASGEGFAPAVAVPGWPRHPRI